MAAAAARANITIGTARTHLEHIFEKTGVRRQAELVRLLLSDS
jgi:DNA-binding CsgD family transcriptional regulator